MKYILRMLLVLTRLGVIVVGCFMIYFFVIILISSVNPEGITSYFEIQSGQNVTLQLFKLRSVGRSLIMTFLTPVLIVSFIFTWWVVINKMTLIGVLKGFATMLLFTSFWVVGRLVYKIVSPEYFFEFQQKVIRVYLCIRGLSILTTMSRFILSGTIDLLTIFRYGGVAILGTM